MSEISSIKRIMLGEMSPDMKRLDQLVRQGMAPASSLPMIHRGLQKLQNGQTLNPTERAAVNNVMQKMMTMVTGDDTIFQRTRQHTQRNRYQTEEVEQLDELDKDTTINYTMAAKQSMKKDSSPENVEKRTKGLAKAAVKLAKESDEESTEMENNINETQVVDKGMRMKIKKKGAKTKKALSSKDFGQPEAIRNTAKTRKEDTQHNRIMSAVLEDLESRLSRLSPSPDMQKADAKRKERLTRAAHNAVMERPKPKSSIGASLKKEESELDENQMSVGDRVGLAKKGIYPKDGDKKPLKNHSFFKTPAKNKDTGNTEMKPNAKINKVVSSESLTSMLRKGLDKARTAISGAEKSTGLSVDASKNNTNNPVSGEGIKKKMNPLAKEETIAEKDYKISRPDAVKPELKALVKQGNLQKKGVEDKIKKMKPGFMETVEEIEVEAESYKAKFDKMLGNKDLGKMSDSDTKAFFKSVDKAHTAKNEK